MLQLAICAYFAVGVLSCLGSLVLQTFFGPSAVFAHGKAARGLAKYHFWDKFTISKQYFWHFYAVGCAASVLSLLSAINAASFCLFFQCLRRLFECFFIMKGSSFSSMHLIHYLIGITYYPALLLSFQFANQHASPIYVCLFAFGSLLQFYCHCVLGQARETLPDSHRPINNRLFRFIHTPHYTAEIIIYSAIAGICRRHFMSQLNLLWVISLLSVSSYNSATWTQKQYNYKQRTDFARFLIIPMIL